MHSLLSPGIRLLGRFGFARKFQILFILFILPLAGSLWMIGLDYRDKLAVISSEKSGVSQLLTLDALDGQLTAQRNLASRWKALDLLREPTPAAKAAKKVATKRSKTSAAPVTAAPVAATTVA